MKKRRNKWCLAAGALVAAGLMWLLPMKAEAAFCNEWSGPSVKYYCATPICYKSIPSYFQEKVWERTCIENDSTRTEYRIEKTDLGCCPHL